MFLFAFFILFGIQPSAWHIVQFHYAVIASILNLSLFYIIALTVWGLYLIKYVLFIRSAFRKEAYDFLYQLLSLEKKSIYWLMLQLNMVLMAPVIVYGLLILVAGMNEGRIVAGAAVLASVGTLILIGTGYSIYLLNKALGNQAAIRSRWQYVFRPGIFTIILRFVFTAQFASLAILKILSFFSLYFLSRSDPGLFEDRMLWLVYITVLVGHGSIIYKNFQFTEGSLRFLRNMPLKPANILVSFIGVYAVLLIPEFWALKGVWLTQQALQEYLWMLLTGPAVLILMHCLQYGEDMKMEELIKLFFGIWVVFIFFSLSSNRWIIPVIGYGASVIIFKISYYSYEKRMDVERLE